jgi:hypothetical protein
VCVCVCVCVCVWKRASVPVNVHRRACAQCMCVRAQACMCVFCLCMPAHARSHTPTFHNSLNKLLGIFVLTGRRVEWCMSITYKAGGWEGNVRLFANLFAPFTSCCACIWCTLWPPRTYYSWTLQIILLIKKKNKIKQLTLKKVFRLNLSTKSSTPQWHCVDVHHSRQNKTSARWLYSVTLHSYRLHYIAAATSNVGQGEFVQSLTLSSTFGHPVFLHTFENAVTNGDTISNFTKHMQATEICIRANPLCI